MPRAALLPGRGCDGIEPIGRHRPGNPVADTREGRRKAGLVGHAISGPSFRYRRVQENGFAAERPRRSTALAEAARAQEIEPPWLMRTGDDALGLGHIVLHDRRMQARAVRVTAWWRRHDDEGPRLASPAGAVAGTDRAPYIPAPTDSG
jgi:hypothetical protein